jgi:hypothetical protein
MEIPRHSPVIFITVSSSLGMSIDTLAWFNIAKEAGKERVVQRKNYEVADQPGRAYGALRTDILAVIAPDAPAIQNGVGIQGNALHWAFVGAYPALIAQGLINCGLGQEDAQQEWFRDEGNQVIESPIEA